MTPSDPTPPRVLGETTYRLLERVREGDRHALDTLFQRYGPPLRRWARGRLPGWARDISDTQDLVQETLLQTFKRINDFVPQHPGALQAYLRQTLLNRIRDEIRRRGRRLAPEELDEALAADDPSPLEAAIGRQALARYERALDELRPQDREAIIARVEMGCSFLEVAEVLGKPTSDAARRATERALVRLAEIMSRDA
jgi:RNA polymerase sigma-70 factor (ECF subfamily)